MRVLDTIISLLLLLVSAHFSTAQDIENVTNAPTALDYSKSNPTKRPTTHNVTPKPTAFPTRTNGPTQQPSTSPTLLPTSSPTHAGDSNRPTSSPGLRPTVSPVSTKSGGYEYYSASLYEYSFSTSTNAPTKEPTKRPRRTWRPTRFPTQRPTCKNRMMALICRSIVNPKLCDQRKKCFWWKNRDRCAMKLSACNN